MPFLDRTQILSAPDLAVTPVPVPEWGEGAQVGIRVMTGSERDAFDELIADAKEGRVKNLRAVLVAMTLCDEHGGRLFTLDEVEALGDKSSTVIERLFLAARDVNRLGPEEVESLKNDSAPAQNGVSGSH